MIVKSHYIGFVYFIKRMFATLSILSFIGLFVALLIWIWHGWFYAWRTGISFLILMYVSHIFVEAAKGIIKSQPTKP